MVKVIEKVKSDVKVNLKVMVEPMAIVLVIFEVAVLENIS